MQRYLEIYVHAIDRLERKVTEGRTYILELYTKDKRECKI
jgi:hypothetical protein